MQRLNLNEFVIAPLLHNLSVVLVILIPVITMRSFAEEKRSGTYELLMTVAAVDHGDRARQVPRRVRLRPHAWCC